MRRAAAIALLLGGCTFGVGPTMGYRAGKATVGWQGGLGMVGHDDTTGGAGSLDFGQSWREGHYVTYGQFSLSRFLMDQNAEGRHYGIEGSVGYSRGDGTSNMIAGAAPYVGRFHGDTCTSDGAYWSASLSIGLRSIAGDLEVYVAPRLTGILSPFCSIAE